MEQMTQLAPVKIGDKLTVAINGYATQGEGVGAIRVLPFCPQ